MPETGDLRADLGAWLAERARTILAPGGRSVARALATASAAGPDQRELFDEVLTRPAGAVVVARLERASADGEEVPAVPPEVTADLITGYLTLATLGAAPLDEVRLRQVLDAVLPPAAE
ncbi:TetR-like C-terminal domain-containing protein [Brachybacterium aquaticum]|uniref:Tetracyclin repressor-like C-terminal domain-containing protein n=1 Tax=Brachybacterium aquaticum TaxID=1432564 RepID=A0A841AAS1_9MICO|nr:TetR-like C-terminal domain-containing protein [Brachybacterium aquaticum]MBB5830294.1 hypothetical protein [Brachybacterium aquaticum]